MELTYENGIIVAKPTINCIYFAPSIFVVFSLALLYLNVTQLLLKCIFSGKYLHMHIIQYMKNTQIFNHNVM